MQITTPTLLLDKSRCINNISNMIDRANRANVRLRPHFKTHQSAHIGQWYRDLGVDCICVSSLTMAQYFADDGWDDITVAFPVNILEIDKINTLASEINLSILIESNESLSFLEKHLNHRVNAWIKIDTGYQRTGIAAADGESITTLLDTLKNSTKVNFKGFLAHTGHNYNCTKAEEILENHHQTVLDLNELKDEFHKQWPQLEVSLGDTPACSISDEYHGIDEMRPGNFVFYDIMQYVLGSCQEQQIAVAMACPVVAKHASRNELVIYGGGVHFSKEYLKADDQGTKLFGALVKITPDGWSPILEGGYLASLSQEHGVIKCNASLFEQFTIGDIIGVLPIHSCMTANIMGHYQTLEGENIAIMGR